MPPGVAAQPLGVPVKAAFSGLAQAPPRTGTGARYEDLSAEGLGQPLGGVVSEAGDGLYQLRHGRLVRIRRWFAPVLACPRCGSALSARTLSYGEADDAGELWLICAPCTSSRDRVLAHGREIPDIGDAWDAT